MRWINLFHANLRKEYIELKRYLPNTIAMVATFYFIFLGLFAGIQFIGDPSSAEANTQYLIVNYVFWFLGLMVIQTIGWEITNEAMRGTLEQLYMSPMGVWRIMAARLASSVVLNIMIITVLLFVTMATTGQWLNIDIITIIPILILTIISMMGVGFMIAGISIIWKQVSAFLQILQFVLAGLTFISVKQAPFLVYFPFVKGVDLVRDVMINGVSLSQIGIADFGILFGNAIFYFVLGLIIFILCERIAMRKGLLAHY
ncbi:ABC transporter permease [Cerasibacillus terrae]|uniref:ABC transporter permease n=1 Tax=Cerasibacillus terrae TaxID=2498845 RepID=A0A5C8NTC0_9BACI|nr:ABC transporter permease [Cerasibacillus terrae]TXL64529.1 ABC transporter permease [Cerasibacillus terrae]